MARYAGNEDKLLRLVRRKYVDPGEYKSEGGNNSTVSGVAPDCWAGVFLLITKIGGTEGDLFSYFNAACKVEFHPFHR